MKNIPITNWLHILTNIIPTIIKVGVVAICIALVWWLVRKLYDVIHVLRQQTTTLELTPPARGDRTPEATSQLFLFLHGLGMSRRLVDRLLGHKTYFTLEIVASKSKGIRYIVHCASSQAASFEQMIASYMPDVKVGQVADYLPGAGSKRSRVLEYRQSEHFAYPLKNHQDLESHDPISYITNAMTKLEASELMSFQLVISPMQSRAASELSHKIMTNDDLMPKLSGQRTPYLGMVTLGINKLLFSAADIVTTSYHGQSRETYRSNQKDLEYKEQVAKRIKPVRTLSYFEHELVESIHHKLEQQLFRADIRVLIQAKTKRALHNRKLSMQSALSLYSVEKNQKLRLRSTKYHLLQDYAQVSFKKRLPSMLKSHSNILSVSEVASLYHFPNTISAKTENVVKSLSKTLPAPVSLKKGTKLDVLLGANHHQGSVTAIGLTEQERARHLYIVGGTGNGKTTMLMYAIEQDMRNGKGLAVLDPHGDLAETILKHVPEERIKDVIYLNPDDLTYPIGINLLELDPKLEGDELLREKDLITESVISVLRKIFSEDDSGGHRIEYVLRNTIQTALTTEGSTLFTIFRLLNDTKYRRNIVKTLQDQDLKNFWQNELGKAGEFQKVKMSAGITAKIGRFLFSASAKRILEQEKSTIDFDDILSSGKILICNFSKGLLGEDTSTLFGTTVLAKLQVASLRRARLQQANRMPFYLYVDEFQNFATMSFVQMLSEARKYKLFLTMAEQSTSQQDQQRLVDIILANVGTVICFRSGSPADERYILPLFYPYIEQGEIANLPAYSFYCRIAAVQAQEPMSGMTVLLSSDGNEKVAKKAVVYSRSTYGVKAKKIETKPERTSVESKAEKQVKQANKPISALK